MSTSGSVGIGVLLIVLTVAPSHQGSPAQQMGFVARVVKGNWVLVRAGTSRTTPATVDDLDPLFAGDRLELREGNGEVRVALFNGDLKPVTQGPFVVPDTRGSGFLVWLAAAANRQRQWFSTVVKSGGPNVWSDGVGTPVNAARTEFKLAGISAAVASGPVLVSALNAAGERTQEITKDAELDTATGRLRLPAGTSLAPGVYEMRQLVRRREGPLVVAEPGDAATWQMLPAAAQTETAVRQYLEATRVTEEWSRAGADVERRRLLRAILISLAFPESR